MTTCCSFWITVVFAVFVVCDSLHFDWNCRTVERGQHYAFPPLPFGFVDSVTRTVQIRFEPSAAAYSCNCSAEPYPGCMSSWNKLWGSSRCGKTNPHHKDSDRFVWRRRTLNSTDLSIAAYSYDLGVKPYSPYNPNLLQPFNTTIEVNVVYTLRMVRAIDNTRFDLLAGVGADNHVLESKTVMHKNQCSNFVDGYKLEFYYGGQCTAPSTVACCYNNDSAT
eukprot:m.13786 g.13786  ORF g.13786 m.13786 type:complete len:221 (-) comp9859_c0_seq1:292-954(-)